MHEEIGEHVEHVPQRSWAPVVLAIGIFFINLAFITGIVVGLLGITVFVAGVFMWVREDARYFREGAPHGE
jgi:membrane-bound ClpP family serine protease